ncbi:unnamed protein product [Aspergillus oryzae var. brunneus]|uniref:Unnamed protein product n=1 Tax=Aspergillus oryzae var. brunneus TaxID=332754 RepID=A0ABQ6KNS1_ASPOZ|nr:unnamed protein product [Aspergillus oryzae var. brunneus]
MTVSYEKYFRKEPHADIYRAQCEGAQHHLIMSYAFNLSSDLAMLCIPIPLAQFSVGRSRKHTMSSESTEHITREDKGLEIWQHTQVAVYEDLEEDSRTTMEQDRRGVYGNGTGLASSTVTTGQIGLSRQN